MARWPGGRRGAAATRHCAVTRGRRVGAPAARLGEDAVALARAVAVLGDAPPVAVAGALADLQPDAVAAAERALAGADVLSRDAPLGFVHPLLRAAVLAELGPVAVLRWRERAAAALADAGAPDEAVAAQLLELEPVGRPWALDALEGAARQALAQGAPATAARLFQRAVAETTPDREPGLLVEAGAALVTSGEPRGIDLMLAACEVIDDDRERAELVTRMGIPMWFAGRTQELAARCRAELETCPPDPGLRFRLRAQRATAAALGSGEPVAPLVGEALELLPEPDGATVEERAGMGLLTLPAAVTGRSAATVRRLGEGAVGTPAQQEEAVVAGYPMFNAVLALLLAEAPGDRWAEFPRMEEGVRRRGALALGLSSALSWRAMAHALTGALADAEIDARTALELAPRSFPTAREVPLTALATALAETGRAREALSLLEGLPESSRLSTQIARLARARALLADGRDDEAAALGTDVGGVFVATDADADGAAFAPWRLVAGDALLATGDAAEAERLATAALALAEAFGASAPIGMALRLLGLATGDPALLEDAERRLAGSPRRLEHARALVDLGAAWRRAGERAKAREPLAAGADLAARCGATVLLDRAQVELRAAGARPRSVLRSGVEALSPSEHRVAELAASGLTNREIAQRLFVSQKTVESQLRAVFRKLDISGRAEIGVRLS